MLNRILRLFGLQLLAREDRKMAQVARTILDSPEATSLAKAHAESIAAALAEGRAICRHCMNPFDRAAQKREWAEIVRIRSVLMIPDSEPHPVMCDACAYTAVAGFNAHATNIGTRNDGPANLALQRLAS